MSSIFSSGDIFGNAGGGGSISLGGFMDDLFGDNEDVAGDSTSSTTAGAGGGTVVKDATVIGGTAGPKAKQSPGAIPKFDACTGAFIDDPVNPTQFCIPNPKVNFTCPPKQIYDYVKQGCVPYAPDLIAGATPQTGVICPYGTKAVGQACVSLVGTGVPTGGGGGGGGAQPAVVPGPSAVNALSGGGVEPWMIALGLGGLALMGGLAVYAKKKQGAGKRSR